MNRVTWIVVLTGFVLWACDDDEVKTDVEPDVSETVDQETTQPDEDMAQPDEDTAQPDEDTAQPDEDTMQPDDNDGEQVEPITGFIADHRAPAAFDTIPAATFDTVRSGYHIYYGHTSHGSQLVTGMEMLAAEDASTYALPPMHEPGGDLGHNGDLAWEQSTRSYLSQHPETNLVIWSWCGGCSDNDEEGINTYLNAMNQLELDFPNVRFVYMTGHLDGSGAADGDNLRANNQRIRTYCQQNNKVLFDFEDLESYDPAGQYYVDETDACGWCSTWCASHDCPSCSDCAHSHCFNCYQKGKAFWWLLARLSGWE
ncbi:MAG: hypothetical protein RBU37_10715 [Myxococcota bacterium]|jgi:hypothetical protein|nr:hypothetical protein [Myxococcota bacterium]